MSRPITFHCPACDQRISAGATVLGRTVECPVCSHSFEAGGQPAAGSAEAPTPPRSAPPPRSSARRKRRPKSGTWFAPTVAAAVTGALMIALIAYAIDSKSPEPQQDGSVHSAGSASPTEAGERADEAALQALQEKREHAALMEMQQIFQQRVEHNMQQRSQGANPFSAHPSSQYVPPQFRDAERRAYDGLRQQGYSEEALRQQGYQR